MWAWVRSWMSRSRGYGSTRAPNRPKPLELSPLDDRAAPTFLDPSSIVFRSSTVSAAPASIAWKTSPEVDVRAAVWPPIPVAVFAVKPTATTATTIHDFSARFQSSTAYEQVQRPWQTGELTIPVGLNRPSSEASPLTGDAAVSWDVPVSARQGTTSVNSPQLPMVSVTPPAFLPEYVSWKAPPDKQPEPESVGVTASALPPSTTVGGPDQSTGNKTITPPATAQPNAVFFHLKNSPSSEVTVQVSHHSASGSVTTLRMLTVPASRQLSIAAPIQTSATQNPTEVVTITVLDAHGVVGQNTQFLKPVDSVGDVALFQAYRVGSSTTAFEHLVKRYEAFVQRVAERVLHQQTEALDIGQQVFLELSRYRGEFAGTLSAWLRTVTKNTAISFLRASRRRLVREQSVALAEAGQTTSWDSLELADAIGQLPADVGEAVRLRYIEGYSQNEAAELAGCPRGTLARRASDGVRALRGLL
jgi:RNA polymerase sigma-70 factor, ECF subfamily